MDATTIIKSKPTIQKFMESRDKILMHNHYKNRMINEEGIMYPNFPRKCVEWLISIQDNIKNYSVYEYGAEAAVAWWRKKSDDYTGLTASEGAAKAMNCRHRWDEDRYVGDILSAGIKAPTEEKLYDIIIINGKWRDECIIPALQRIKKGGYIIINNYHQNKTEFRPAYWQLTTPLLEKQPVVIFHDENSDARTAVFQVVN